MTTDLKLYNGDIDNILYGIENHLKEKYNLRMVVDIDTFKQDFAFIEAKLHKVTYCIQIEIADNNEVHLQAWCLIDNISLTPDQGEGDFQIQSYDYNFENMFVDVYEQGKEMYKHYNHLKSLDEEKKKYIEEHNLENLAIMMVMDYISNGCDDAYY